MVRRIVAVALVATALSSHDAVASGAHHRHGRPAILFVHGGGWARGTAKDDERAFAHDLAQRTGWIVKRVDYPIDDPRFKVEPAAITASLRVLRARHGVNLDRVYVWGESAGGNLAALIAYRHPRLVAGVVSVSGPTDMRTAYPKIPDLISAYEGETPQESDARGHVRYDTTSPTHEVDASAPPTFLANSTRDPLVSPSQARELRDRLRALGVRHKMEIVHDSGAHATMLEPDVEADAISFLRSVRGR